jgi:hypothetical protein
MHNWCDKTLESTEDVETVGPSATLVSVAWRGWNCKAKKGLCVIVRLLRQERRKRGRAREVGSRPARLLPGQFQFQQPKVGQAAASAAPSNDNQGAGGAKWVDPGPCSRLCGPHCLLFLRRMAWGWYGKLWIQQNDNKAQDECLGKSHLPS